ncbi:neutral zinc metallopeptidase, partial [Escherichia coli]
LIHADAKRKDIGKITDLPTQTMTAWMTLKPWEPLSVTLSEEALNAAQAIGDDRLQQQSQGRVVPDSFTHGTSQQRYSWFKRGFDSGDPAQCNTFGKSI